MSRLTVSFKGTVLQVVPLRQGEMTIGSDPGCDIHIDSLAIEGRHASITTTGSDSVIRDLGSPGGTFVNNARIQEHTLKDRDLVQVGKHTLGFTQDARAVEEFKLEPKAAPKKTAWLQILSGQNVGKTISLNRKMTNLGKPGVQTAVIVHRNDGYFLSHLEGEQVPTVDGQPIGDRSWQLKDGDKIQMGNVTLQFYLQ